MKNTYEIDPSHSSVHFSIRHMMISNVRGGFSGVKGTIAYDPDDLAQSGIRAEIDVNSISTLDEKRDAHLKTADFFDVEHYPDHQLREHANREAERHGVQRHRRSHNSRCNQAYCAESGGSLARRQRPVGKYQGRRFGKSQGQPEGFWAGVERANGDWRTADWRRREARIRYRNGKSADSGSLSRLRASPLQWREKAEHDPFVGVSALAFPVFVCKLAQLPSRIALHQSRMNVVLLAGSWLVA